MSVGRSRVSHWELAVAAEAALLAFWMREPSFWLALGVLGVGAVAALAALSSRRPGPILTAVLAGAAAGAVLSVSLRVRSVERQWPEVREALILDASRALDASLASAVALARSTADSAAALVDLPRSTAMERLQDNLPPGGPEHGATAIDAAGRPWIWAGRHRIDLEPNPQELSAHITPFYVVLEARRQVGAVTAVGHVVLAADSAVPDRQQTLAWRFTDDTGFRLAFYDPSEAPGGTDVFDYCLPSCAVGAGETAPDTLFSVQAVAPSQGSRKLEILSDGGRTVGVLATVTVVLLVIVGGRLARWAGVLGVLGLLLFTPVGERIALGPLFSSATFYLGALGPFSSSAGALLLLSVGAAVVALQLSRRPLTATVPGALAAAAIAVAAPWILGRLATGISPPVTAIGIGMWIGWQLTLMMAAAALALLAYLLLGGRHEVPRWLGWLGAALAGVLAAIGLASWRPEAGWPVWYGLLWIPPFWLVIQPASRVRRLIWVAVLAGSASGMLTWGAVVRGRLLLAERDASRLEGGDPVAIGFLERFVSDLLERPPPRTEAQLYSRWRHSPLSQDDYPGVLTVWGAGETRTATLELAQLDLDSVDVRVMARAARATGQPILRSVETLRGVHYIAASPFPDSSVVTVGVAPRSQLIEPVLVARFLRGERRLEAPYAMYLGEPAADEAPDGTGLTWWREGWTLRATDAVELPGGVRHLHASVELHDLSQLLVRGALLLILDVAVLLLVGVLGQVIAGHVPQLPGWPEQARLRSYRNRLAIALGAFFVIPTLGFATWSIGRLRVEAVRGRDLLTQQTLSDAVGAVGTVSSGEGASQALDQLSDQLSADLMLYEDGALRSASAEVLAQLGLLSPFLPPRVHLALAERDVLEITDDASIGGQQTRVGYRVLGRVGRQLQVLAVPRLVEFADIQREQEDLAFGLVLVTLIGVGGAIGLAAFASRSLARPVQSLESAAGAVGRGDPVPPFDTDIPTEFVSVVNAFERMAQDVEASQDALESARRRTATVLSNVATGVVALDDAMRVTIANPAAQALLDTPLFPGAEIRRHTEGAWGPVWDWVRLALAESEPAERQEEFTVDVRRIRAQVAPLQTETRGCVVALDDVTEITQAVRVLAWGEVARQVAHEIKNPLTPIRLGVQHLQRARRQGSADFDATLQRTARQILAEIERLDAIARAFARFGTPPTEAGPLEVIDLAAVARDAAALYALGGGTSVTVRADQAMPARVRKDEVKEVLINLVENARDAGANSVDIVVLKADEGGVRLDVTDNGSGIAGHDLPHVFEPHFSTTTSGTGLGLAICRRLVESWGGNITVMSDVDRGTTVTISMPPLTMEAGE
jgi:signal transduction histidine kinase